MLDDPLGNSTSYWSIPLVEQVGHQREAVAEDVDVDVEALSRHVPSYTADQPRGQNRSGNSMNRKASSRMSQEVLEGGPRALVHPGHRLDLVAGSPCCWAESYARPVAVLDAELLGGLAALAVKYSDSVRRYIIWAAEEGDLHAGSAFISHMRDVRRFEPIGRRRPAGGRS